ncbi:MAG: hypothetical protein MJK12_09360 [Colwellia sp.]|nr:hypothetical protein [Colwellia sp.]
MFKLISSLFITSLLVVMPSLVFEGNSAQAAEAEQSVKKIKRSKKVPAMRNRVYSQLARAQKLADEGDKIEGFNVLDEVKDRIDSLNSYERAMLFNFYGFMYYGNEDTALAIDSFNQVIAEQDIPEPLYLSTLYSLAQLSMQQQDFQQTLKYLNKWQQANNKKLNTSQQMLFAQVYYQTKDYQLSLDRIELARLITPQKVAKEHWLILQRANYFELKQSMQVTKVMEQLVRHYSKAEYWLQLGAMYGETNQENKQLAIMEAAWQAGYINSSLQILNLAQLYRFHGVPFKAAKLLEEAIGSGAITAQEKHLGLLAQAYIAAKNDEKAIEVLIKAADISESGQFDAQLAQTYLNLEKWLLAIISADKALSLQARKNVSKNKSDVKSYNSQAGTMLLVKGIASFNLKDYGLAKLAFTHAKKHSQVKKTAQQWFHYVDREQNQAAQLAMLR